MTGPAPEALVGPKVMLVPAQLVVLVNPVALVPITANMATVLVAEPELLVTMTE